MKTNCTGYRQTPRIECAMLRDMLCRGGDCPFYKTENRAETDRRASFTRRYKRQGPFTGFDKKYLEEEREYGD